MTPKQLSIADRITEYLSGGGLFNPECANHDAVRDLLIDARDELHMLRLHLADKNADISAMGATRVKLEAERGALKRESFEALAIQKKKMQEVIDYWQGIAESRAEFKGE